MWRLIKLAAPFWRRIILAALLGFATIGSSVGLMTTAAYIIAKAALRPSIADLQVAVVGVRFFGISRGLFRYLERNISHDINFRLLARLRVWFYRALEPLAPARLMQYRSGDLLSRIVADVDTLENLYVRVLAPPLVAALVGGLMWVFMGSLAPSLAITLLIALALAGLGLPLFARQLGRRTGEEMVQVRAELNVAMVDTVQGMADLLAFGQGTRYQEHITALGRQLARLQARMARIAGLHGALGGLLMNLGVLAALVVAIPLIRSAELDGVILAVLILGVMSSFEAVLPLPAALQYLDNSLEAGRRLFEVVDTEPVVPDPPTPASLPAPPHGSLDVRELTFRYAPNEPPALNKVSFTLPPGGRIAIVGPSGAGKSTLVHLLLRFWDYKDGNVTLGDTEIREYCQDDVRSLISVVSQHTHLFSCTVRENLLLARPEASMEEIVTATQQAQIHDFIHSLPQGYDTWIGDKGLRLSAGERQRLAVARAILKNAPLLILDEPTANLDTITEREVMRELLGVMEKRSTLVITHRLVGLTTMDEILVLRGGRIIERGRHHDLIQLGECYRLMWEQQNQTLN